MLIVSMVTIVCRNCASDKNKKGTDGDNNNDSGVLEHPYSNEP